MFQSGRKDAGWKVASVALALGLALAVGPAWGQSGPAVPTAGEEAPAPAPPPVGLDKLLRLPKSHEVREDQGAVRGGETKAEWVSRFRAAQEDLVKAREALAATRAELEEVSGDAGSWSLSAPTPGGAGPSQSNPGDKPLDYTLSSELKKNREEVARMERQLRELQIEANLKGVPEEWQNPEKPGQGAR